jgi:hypothetical protein
MVYDIFFDNVIPASSVKILVMALSDHEFLLHFFVIGLDCQDVAPDYVTLLGL